MTVMDLLRKYIWVWVIVGIIFVCVVTVLIFILINLCISKRGKHKITALRKRSDFNVSSNKYQEGNIQAKIPSLPPRTQFLPAEAQSYENLADVPDYVQDTAADYEQDTAADYEQCTADYEQCTADYEQSIPDYVKVEDEKIPLPPPPYQDPDSAEDNASTEDYDDIGDERQGEEDYDDVG